MKHRVVPKASEEGRVDIVLVSTWQIECGIATYTEDLATEFVKHGHRVTVLCQKSSKAGALRHVPGVQAFPAFTYRHQAAAREVFTALGSSKKPPDVVHVQHEFGLFPNTRELINQIREYRAAPVVVTLHTPSIRGAALRVPCASFVHSPLLHKPGLNRWYTPHGVREWVADDIADGRCSALRDRHGIPPHHRLFLVPGFVGVNKGQVEIIEAFLEAEPPDAVLAVVGRCADGAFSQQIEAIVEATDRRLIYDEGFKTRDELDTWFDAADVVVLGGPKVTSESASGQLATAIAAGKPVFARDVEIYRDNGGAAILWRNKAQLVRLLRATAQSAGDVIIDNLAVCAQFQQSRRSWSRIANNHTVVYERLQEAR